MSIAFKCPKCQTGYTVKTDMAGKRVVCRSCKAPMRVPAPVASAAVPDPEAESLASSLLGEEAVAEREENESFEVECPNCMEQVAFDLKVAGKQAPCPSCRRIMRVPQPASGKGKDWRAADSKPVAARRDNEVAPSGAWGNTTGATIVNRESLLEAGAIRDRKYRPTTMRQKVTRLVVAVCVLAGGGIGAMLWQGKRVETRREIYLQRAQEMVEKSDPATAGVAAEVYRLDALYRAGSQPPSAEDVVRRLGIARERLSKADERADRTVLLTEIALTLADLGGDKKQVEAGTHVKWADMQKEMRRTVKDFGIGDPKLREGGMQAMSRLARKFGLSGEPGSPVAPMLAAWAFGTPEEIAEALAAIGLELLSLGDPGRAKATELAAQAKSLLSDPGRTPARLIALYVALGQSISSDSVVPANLAIGQAEGFARAGDMEKARAAVQGTANFHDRMTALVAVAAARPDDPTDIQKAVDVFAEHLGNRDIPDWPIIRLAQLCSHPASAGAAGKLDETLANAVNLSDRAQSVRAWARYELLRGKSKITEADVKAIAPDTTLGYKLAWGLLAKSEGGPPVAVIEAWPEAGRAIAFVAAALVLQEKGK